MDMSTITLHISKSHMKDLEKALTFRKMTGQLCIQADVLDLLGLQILMAVKEGRKGARLYTYKEIQDGKRLAEWREDYNQYRRMWE